MNKTVLLASAAVLALSVGGASAKPAHPGVAFKGTAHQAIFKTPKGSKTLYDQSDAGSGEAIDSQNFESTFAAYDDAGADDFTVPSGHTWTVKEVDAPGLYFNGYGPASSENVTFYKDSGGVPGAITKKGQRNGLSGTDNAGSFAIDLTNGGATKGVKLAGGHYWVSVVANCSFTGGCGEWGWSTSSTLHGTAGQWQNPGGGFGICPTWGPITSCISGDTDPDFQFVLKGKDKS
jgi:hypothetical protein